MSPLNHNTLATEQPTSLEERLFALHGFMITTQRITALQLSTYQAAQFLPPQVKNAFEATIAQVIHDNKQCVMRDINELARAGQDIFVEASPIEKPLEWIGIEFDTAMAHYTLRLADKPDESMPQQPAIYDLPFSAADTVFSLVRNARAQTA